jgi:phosphoenolpyruvate carboxykinase (ATP)
MKITKTPTQVFCELNFSKNLKIHHQLSIPQLVEKSLLRKEGILSQTGALAIDTGEFTGRSPKDRFIVADNITRDKVWWNDINIQFSEVNFNQLYVKVVDYLNQQEEIFTRDALACADEENQIGISVITEHAFQNIFANNLFLRPTSKSTQPKERWSIIAAPGFKANPEEDGTRQGNFTIINFTKRIILIGGSAYTGEIKKGIFSVLNFLLPFKGILPMHCSANKGKDGETAIFFGLSGTGKTTLSADPSRNLIGDDEHGWGDKIFNFEGGCYAKCVNLSEEKEPDIYKAIKFGSLLENINFFPNTRAVDYNNIQKTENTRVAYPINFIENSVIPSIGNSPKHIFFLTADAFGVLPPVSKLKNKQAMFYFLSGYTAKVAGTETGINEPQATFSACFGKAFLPLHPTIYANLLEKKIANSNVKVWLINTGWCGGVYGVGNRIELKYTRAIINSILIGELENEEFTEHPIFQLQMPIKCNNVPAEILNPKLTWKDKDLYDITANNLNQKLIINHQVYQNKEKEELKMEILS